MHAIRRPLAAAFVVAGLILFATLARAQAASDPPAPGKNAPANTLAEMFHSLGACLSAEGSGQAGEMTLRFSVRRDGALIGKPRITYSKLPEDPEARRRFMDDMAAAFDRCVPVRITAGLGGALAGRPLSLRLGVKAKETDI
jgi:hypothetical protein